MRSLDLFLGALVLLAVGITSVCAHPEKLKGIRPTVIKAEGASGLYSIDLGALTITKIRTAVSGESSSIVASSYEGSVISLSYEGRVRWINKLSGYMNHDLWCADLTGDGASETLVANADGSVYCLSDEGELMWSFKANDAPMYAVAVLQHEGAPYVVCGGFDKTIRYLNVKGELVKTIESSSYSKEKTWGKSKEKRIPPKFLHIANFIRPIRGEGGKEVLAVHGAFHGTSTQGSVYLFEGLEDKPYQNLRDFAAGSSYGDFSTCDLDGDGVDEILLGASGMIQSAAVAWVNPKTEEHRGFKPSDLRKKVIDRFGYRVAQTVEIGEGEEKKLLTLFGSRVLLNGPEFDSSKTEVLVCRYSFNDLWKDPETGLILLGSAQSGGSCVHVIDPKDPGWKTAYQELEPAGKLKRLLANTAEARERLKTFQRPDHERSSRTVYFMTESLRGESEAEALALEKEHGNLVFLQSSHMPRVEKWDRSSIENEHYRNRLDRRMKYELTQEQALEKIQSIYDSKRNGVSFWGGHGNDPYMFSTDTMKKAVDAGGGEKSVFIYPELEHYGDGFDYVMENHFYPMAEYFQGKNAHIYVRTKHAFWQSIVHLPLWSRLLSGEFADVFIPSMEETSDKSMDQSVAGRVGVWASGATNQWGARGARDNPSLDRLRQHSHQMIPNHFLRTLAYNASYGATYLNNFPVDQDYFSILYELIAKGALYIPKREEIVSFSPVHLSMTAPDKHYLDEGNNVKWLTFFDDKFEQENPMVFSRLNGSWPGAATTEWDFSRYAAGVKERRHHFLPPYENGLVLITPPQNGVYADKEAKRGAMAENLHPLYREILKEYITDGRNYLSADGEKTYPADKYYEELAREIKEGSKLLPLTVSGEVAWVNAHTDKNRLRLSLFDSGYLNPNDREAVIHFHTVQPVTITDVLTGEELAFEKGTDVHVDVPLGLFRFLEIEFEGNL